MKTLYIECNTGAAGDMLMSALSELIDDKDGFISELNALKIPNVEVKAEQSQKCGIVGTHIRVSVGGVEESEDMHAHHHHEHEHYHDHEHHHEHEHHHDHDHEHHHHHTGMAEIEGIISSLAVSDKVKKDALAVYTLIAEAESQAHGREIEQIHFHEVGTMDAVCDIVGCCILFDKIKADKIVVSPVNTGRGQVHCAHGILPVPAPATAYILRDIPIYSNDISGELCTPTGAALLKHFANDFGTMPVMRIQKTGYGMGTKDLPSANCVRAMLGSSEDKTGNVTELMFNTDDMTGEQTGFAIGKLFEAGALEVYTTPVGMKKNRTGVLITCICGSDKKADIVRAIFKYTTTIGIRENTLNRYVLDRTEEIAETKYGRVRVKRSTGYGVTRIKPEYDDLERIANENNISITDIDITKK